MARIKIKDLLRGVRICEKEVKEVFEGVMNQIAFGDARHMRALICHGFFSSH